MNKRADALLRFLITFIDENGYPPTIREMMAGCGLPSTSMTEYHLTALETDGLVTRKFNRARSYQVTERGHAVAKGEQDMAGVKGRVAAKRDAIEPEIREALRKVGATVYLLDKPADLLVGYRGQTFLLEVKDPKTGRLTPDEDKFFETWNGGYAQVVRSVVDALIAIGAIGWQDVKGAIEKAADDGVAV